jgi:cob(I)alamin adenosyltransferase
MVKILNKIGFNKVKDAIDIDEIKKARATLTTDNNDEVISSLGTNIVMSVAGVLLENLPNIEKDLYELIGNLANMKPKDVAQMDIAQFMETIVAVLKKEEFKDFFREASKLIK